MVKNDFGKNFAENFELVLSRSLSRRAQLYVVPTLSLHAPAFIERELDYQRSARPAVSRSNCPTGG